MKTEKDRVVVGEYEKLAVSSLTATRAIWGMPIASSEFRAACRIRYRHIPAPCRVVMLSDNRFEVHFDSPQMSVTPGQAAVL